MTHGCTTGHGCGHNLIGAGGIGAAVVLKNWIRREKIPGTIRVFGAAAEEAEGAKIYMARAGVYDNLDACLHWHPAPVTTPWCAVSTTVNMLRIEFFGKSSHAANAPWYGRNALHAAELFGHGIALMREHLEPTARTHYVLEAPPDEVQSKNNEMGSNRRCNSTAYAGCIEHFSARAVSRRRK